MGGIVSFFSGLTKVDWRGFCWGFEERPETGNRKPEEKRPGLSGANRKFVRGNRSELRNRSGGSAAETTATTVMTVHTGREVGPAGGELSTKGGGGGC